MWRLLLVSVACVEARVPTIPMRGIHGTVDIPLAGIGVWQYNDSVAEKAVSTAFQLGYRHVDTAVMYANAKGVGKALKSSGLKREDYFVTSKMPVGLNLSATEAGLKLNLQELGLDYVDLMLVHIPATGAKARQEQWQLLEAFAKAGKARAIGVSHHCRRQLEDVLAVATLPVAVNQVQYHVGMGSASDMATDDKSWVQKQGILYESFSPLCGPCDPPDNKELITGRLVTEIGKRHGKTGAQIALKWLVQQDIPVIPKSSKKAHLQENIDLFDFTLTQEEMAQLTAASKPAVGGGPGPQDSGDCGMPMEVEEANQAIV